jgi:anti-sigma-K factor RskA
VFNAERLPALDAARVYQLWTIHNGTPVSAGLLRLDAQGGTSHQAPAPAGATAPEAVAVSIEPAGGVPAPTGAIVLIGKPN